MMHYLQIRTVTDRHGVKRKQKGIKNKGMQEN